MSLAARLRTKHAFIDRSVAEFEAVIAELAREIEKELYFSLRQFDTDRGRFNVSYANRERLLAVKQELEDVLGAKGYRQATEGLLDRADDLLDHHQALAKEYGQHAQFLGGDPEALRILKGAMTAEFAGISEGTAREIGKQLDYMVVSGRSVKEAAGAIRTTLDNKFQRYAKTYAETSLAIYDSAINALSYPQEDGAHYIYVGPLDDLTRPFCRERVGRIFTVAEIRNMDNGQLPDVFLTRGGYNCRHDWLYVPPDDLEIKDALTALAEESEKPAVVSSPELLEKLLKGEAAPGVIGGHLDSHGHREDFNKNIKPLWGDAPSPPANIDDMTRRIDARLQQEGYRLTKIDTSHLSEAFYLRYRSEENPNSIGIAVATHRAEVMEPDFIRGTYNFRITTERASAEIPTTWAATVRWLEDKNVFKKREL